MAGLAGWILTLILAWVLFPILARVGGALMILVGLAAASTHESWAGWTIFLGVVLWLAGSWLFAVKTSRYSSRPARMLFEHTPLKWTLWQHWRRALDARVESANPYYADPHPHGAHHYR